MSQAETEIERFRQGERYQPPPPVYLSSGGIREEELMPFAAALRQESAAVREEIVRLLADLGKRSDPLYPIGGQLIREPRIISILIDDGLSRDDLGREASLTALQELAPPRLLLPHGRALTHDLETSPATTAFLLLAKAKPAGAAPLVRKLLGTPRWLKELNARVAMAALGETAIEKEYADAFTSAANGKDKANAARILGLIGTETALRTLASELRTDSIIDEPALYYERSVRVDILQALSYNFPEEVALYETQIHDDSGYERAERFCEARLGVKWMHPRPPYLKVQGYPVPEPE